jgi:hypothetical protein
MYREGEGEAANGKPWVAASKTDFINRHENRSIENGNHGRGRSRVISLGSAWQTWPDRKTADGTVLDPRCAPGVISNGRLNMVWLRDQSGARLIQVVQKMIRKTFAAVTKRF